MRNPNGYGSVIKLGGKRRRPYAVRVTRAYALDPEQKRVVQRYSYLGYYAKRADAIRALAEYNASPYDTDVRNLTLRQIYDRWLPTRAPQVTKSSLYRYDICIRILAPLADMPIRDIRLVHLQRVIDESDRSIGTLSDARQLASALFDYAIKNDICDKNYARYIDLSNVRAGKEIERVPFSAADIDALWRIAPTSEPATVILMLIYTGVRVGELLELKKENLHLSERYFDVVHSKTEAGLRRVPIAKKVLPFFEAWAAKSAKSKTCPTVLINRQGKPFIYQSFLKFDWTETLRTLGLESHRPHDTRHTCISLLSMAGVQPELIRAIVGHKGQTLTENVYTHFDFNLALEAIDKI